MNDRTVIWQSAFDGTVQYDGPAVRDGARFPKVSLADFQKWADRDVTDELPAGEYVSWPLSRDAAQAAAKGAAS